MRPITLALLTVVCLLLTRFYANGEEHPFDCNKVHSPLKHFPFVNEKNCTLTVPLVIDLGAELSNRSTLTTNNTLTAKGWLNNSHELTNTGTLNSTYYLTNTYGAKLINKLTLNTSGTTTTTAGPAGLDNLGTLENHSKATLTNSGTLVNKANGKLINNGGTLINDSNGALTNSATLVNKANSKLINNGGTLINDSNGALTNYDTLTNTQGTLANKSTLNNEKYGTLTNYDTLINETSEGKLTNDGNLFNYKKLEIASGARLTNSGNLVNKANGKLINNGGTLINDSNGALTNYDTLTNTHGTLANKSTLNNEKDGTLTNYDTLINETSEGKLTNDGNLFNYKNLEITAGSTLTNSGNLVNKANGTLTNSHALKNDGQLTNEKNGTLTNNGVINTQNSRYGKYGFINYGIYTGHGKVIGSWIDHGKTQLGNTAGVMTIDGDYFKVAGSKEIELGGLVNGGGDKSLTEFDWLHVTGNVELAGLLNVSLIDGFKLGRGMSFNILAVDGQLSGQYDELAEGDLVGYYDGQDLFITYIGGDGNDVSLYTNPIPEPATLLLTLLGLLALATTAHRTRCG